MAVAPMLAGRLILRRRPAARAFDQTFAFIGAAQLDGEGRSRGGAGDVPLWDRLAAQRHAELVGEVVAVAPQQVVRLGFILEREAVEHLVDTAASRTE